MRPLFLEVDTPPIARDQRTGDPTLPPSWDYSKEKILSPIKVDAWNLAVMRVVRVELMGESRVSQQGAVLVHLRRRLP